MGPLAPPGSKCKIAWGCQQRPHPHKCPSGGRLDQILAQQNNERLANACPEQDLQWGALWSVECRNVRLACRKDLQASHMASHRT